jgi:hypothetical protein
MIETIVLAILVSKLKKNKISPIFKSWTIYPLMLMCLLYLILEIMIFKGIYFEIQFTTIFKTLLFLSVFILVIKYKLYASSAIGSLFLLAGSFLNFLAMSANNGKMPVFITLSKLTGYANNSCFSKINDIHIMGNSAAHLKILTDIFDVGYCVMSIGDILIRAFIFIIVYKAIEKANLDKVTSLDTNINLTF